jgi:lysyl-tRNA synthetase class 2
LESRDEGQQPVEQLIANRRAKLDALIELGQDPFPRRYRVESSVSEIRTRYEEMSAEELEAAKPSVRLGGRLRAIRGHGKVSFADLSDGASQLQLYLRKNDIDETSWAVFKQLDLGDFLGVVGTVFRTRAGELSVAVADLQVLAKALRPLPEKYHGLADRESRARQRYLDLLSNPASRKVFEVRSKVVSSLRRRLEAAGYIEVETPMMQPIPGGATARPFVTHHNTLDLDLYLRIAPELYLKRLIIGGFERVFELNRNFRNEGISTRHNPEFTMLEFYCAYSDYELMMDFTEELVTGVAEEVVGRLQIPWGDQTIDFSRPWRRLALKDAILEYSDLTPEDLVDRKRMEAAARELEVQRIDERSDGNLLAELYEMTAEPKMINPTFIKDFPREISPFAKSVPGDPDTVERFELFIGGLEVANAFSELNDPDEQRRRLEAQAAEQGGEVDEDFVLAMEHGMPPTGGEGIGIDRLVMLLTDQQSIRDAILFPQLRPRE